VVYQAQFAPRIAAIRDQLEQVKLFLEIDDGSGEHLEGAVSYEDALQAAEPMPRIERSNDDLYMLYTGGTTGMPKGVMYDHKSFATALLAKGFEMREMEPPTDASSFGPCSPATPCSQRHQPRDPRLPDHARNRHVDRRDDSAQHGWSGNIVQQQPF